MCHWSDTFQIPEEYRQKESLRILCINTFAFFFWYFSDSIWSNERWLSKVVLNTNFSEPVTLGSFYLQLGLNSPLITSCLCVRLGDRVDRAVASRHALLNWFYLQITTEILHCAQVQIVFLSKSKEIFYYFDYRLLLNILHNLNGLSILFLFLLNIKLN